MPHDPIVATSKLLSYVLRHRPDSIGLALDAHGWAGVDDLLARLAAAGHAVDLALIERVVARTGPASAPARATRSRSTWLSPKPSRRQCSTTAPPAVS